MKEERAENEWTDREPDNQRDDTRSWSIVH